MELCRGKVISTWIFQNLHVGNKKGSSEILCDDLIVESKKS